MPSSSDRQQVQRLEMGAITGQNEMRREDAKEKAEPTSAELGELGVEILIKFLGFEPYVFFKGSFSCSVHSWLL